MEIEKLSTHCFLRRDGDLCGFSDVVTLEVVHQTWQKHFVYTCGLAKLRRVGFTNTFIKKMFVPPEQSHIKLRRLLLWWESPIIQINEQTDAAITLRLINYYGHAPNHFIIKATGCFSTNLRNQQNIIWSSVMFLLTFIGRSFANRQQISWPSVSHRTKWLSLLSFRNCCNITFQNKTSACLHALFIKTKLIKFHLKKAFSGRQEAVCFNSEQGVQL